MERFATISQDGLYRYSLTRRWGQTPIVTFVGLNPSTADGEVDDPTIRRCVRFAQDWGFGILVMVNLFAYRATKPARLVELDEGVDPVGPRNDTFLRVTGAGSRLVIGAWGAHALAVDRAAEIEPLLGDYAVLGKTASGAPRHPLYMRADSVPVHHATGEPVALPRDRS